MIRKGDETATVPVSFVDLFACGLGAVVLYWLMLIASIPSASRLPGSSTSLRLRVSGAVSATSPAITDDPPMISAMCAMDRDQYFPDRQAGNNQGPIFTTRDPGTNELRVLFRSTNTLPDDSLTVFLQDLRQWPQDTKVTVDWELESPRLTTPKRGSFPLSPLAAVATNPLQRSGPAVRVSLADLFHPNVEKPPWTAITQ